jgi:hypothetical protein
LARTQTTAKFFAVFSVLIATMSVPSRVGDGHNPALYIGAIRKCRLMAGWFPPSPAEEEPIALEAVPWAVVKVSVLRPHPQRT